MVITGWDETSEQETVEIIHEALIREWGTLRLWIEVNREFRIWQERLKSDVLQWKNKNYLEEALLQGTRLAIAQNWFEQRQDELTSVEKNYINTSARVRDRERGKQKRRRQFTIGGLVGGLILVSTFAGISEIGRTDAEAGRISSAAEQLFSQNNHEVALTEAIKAGKLINQSIWKPWIAPETKMEVISRLREIVYGYQIKTFKGHSRAIHNIHFSPDGKTIAAVSDLPLVIVWDILTGEPISSSNWSKWLNTINTSSSINEINFSTDGRIISNSL
ncbi:MAG: myosin kinase, partial [Rivularia sp. ALOHA_DT_140]|nr:myosin kinase [Rivularia sp. ALOHA_DT_140]